MANLITWLKFSGARLVTGLPVASGFARFYVPGSDVAVDIFADAAETEPLTQPVTLDAAGRAAVYCAEQADIVITTSTGAAVGTGDSANTLDAEQINATWGGSPVPLSTALTAIAAALAGDSYVIKTSGAAAPTFEFDPDSIVNVFSMTYAGAVTDATIAWPAPAPTIPAGKRFTLIFQFATGTTTAVGFHVHFGASIQQVTIGRTTPPRSLEEVILDITGGFPATFSADFRMATNGVLVQTTEWAALDGEPWE